MGLTTINFYQIISPLIVFKQTKYAPSIYKHYPIRKIWKKWGKTTIPRIEPKPNNPKWVILKNLLSAELNATKLAEKMSIGVSAIRNHLETLEQKGHVKHSFKRVSKGRPKKMYKLTKKGSQLFPRMNKEILQKTIKFIDENLGRETLQNMLSEIATELGLDLEKKINPKESEEILQIKEALDDWGFYPKLSEEEAAYFIEYNNCLFPKIGKEFSGCFCGKIVSTATSHKTKVKEIKCRGNGKDKCLHKLIPQESEEGKK